MTLRPQRELRPLGCGLNCLLTLVPSLRSLLFTSMGSWFHGVLHSHLPAVSSFVSIAGDGVVVRAAELDDENLFAVPKKSSYVKNERKFCRPVRHFEGAAVRGQPYFMALLPNCVNQLP